MINKNYIIGGVVILVIISGVLFFTQDNNSTSDTSVLDKGIKNLTRESAAKMIETAMKANPNLANKKQFVFNEQLARFVDSYIPKEDMEKWRHLEQEGYIQILEEKPNPYDSGKVELHYNFTSNANEYFINLNEETNYKYVRFGDVAGVEVAGLTAPAVENGQNTRTADFTATFKATPIGAILDEIKATEPFQWKAKFVLYDDGWRIATDPMLSY